MRDQTCSCHLFRMLLKSGADCNLAMEDGRTPLHIAAETGIYIATQLWRMGGHLYTLQQKQVHCKLAMEDGRTPHFSRNRYIATQTWRMGGHLYILQQKQVHCNLAMEDGRTPLHIATETGTLQHSHGGWQDTATHCNRNRYLAIQLWRMEKHHYTLQQKQVHYNLAMEDGRTPLHIAIETGTLQHSYGGQEDTCTNCSKNSYIATQLLGVGGHDTNWGYCYFELYRYRLLNTQYFSIFCQFTYAQPIFEFSLFSFVCCTQKLCKIFLIIRSLDMKNLLAGLFLVVVVRT